MIGAKAGLRSLFVVLLVVTGTALAAGHVASASGDDEFPEGDEADPPPGTTVVATDSNAWFGGERSVDGPLQGTTTNAVMYVLPMWRGLVELGALVAFVLTLLVWGATELYWTSWRLGVNWPLRIERGG